MKKRAARRRVRGGGGGPDLEKRAARRRVRGGGGLRNTASTMVSLVPGLGSRKFATKVVYLSLASLGLVAANSRLNASLTFYVRNPNLVRFFQIFFQKFFPKFFQYFFQNFCQNCFQNCDTRLPQWYLWSLGLVAANSRLRLCTCPLRLWAW